MNTLFIGLEGVDGVGKSTLAPIVASRFVEASIEIRSRKSVAEDSEEIRASMERLRTTLWPDMSAATWIEIPPQYWTHLQVAWYTMAGRFVVEPLIDSGKTVLMDGWYYKSLAKATLDNQGVKTAVLEEAYRHVLVPDLTVYLRSDIGAVFERHDDFRFYEMGGSASYDSRGRDSFIDHQQKMEQAYLSVIPQDRLIVVDVDPDAAPAENASVVEAALRRHSMIETWRTGTKPDPNDASTVDLSPK